MFELKVLTHFAAAHKLQMVAEKCENLHGHNWKVEAVVKGENLNESGVLIDFGDIKSYLAQIMSKLDHKYLNEIEPFKSTCSSSERIAVYIAEELGKLIEDPNIKVSKITVWESDNASATYVVK